MENRKIVVVGSSNMDMVVKTDHIPAPGETVLSGSFFMNPGGKGANQAVAVARLGGEAVFISKMGNDVFGKQFSQLFSEEGIDIRYLVSDEDLPSGVALITVDEAGENSIVVASGANAALEGKDIDGALEQIASANILLVQLEIPMKTVDYVVRFAAGKGVKVILNPAPANTLSQQLLECVYILTPNKKEASMIAGIDVTDMESAKRSRTDHLLERRTKCRSDHGLSRSAHLYQRNFFGGRRPTGRNGGHHSRGRCLQRCTGGGRLGRKKSGGSRGRRLRSSSHFGNTPRRTNFDTL